MSATMSGDTPLRDPISIHCGLSQPTLENGVPCKHWGLRDEEKDKVEIKVENAKNPIKTRHPGPFPLLKNLLYLVPQEQQKDVKGVTTR